MHTEISPWVEKLSPYRLVIAIGAAGLVLVVALVWVAWRWSVAEDRMEMMKKQAEVGFLQAPSHEPHGAHRPARAARSSRSAAASSPSASISSSMRAPSATRAFA